RPICYIIRKIYYLKNKYSTYYTMSEYYTPEIVLARRKKSALKWGSSLPRTSSALNHTSTLRRVINNPPNPEKETDHALPATDPSLKQEGTLKREKTLPEIKILPSKPTLKHPKSEKKKKLME